MRRDVHLQSSEQWVVVFKFDGHYSYEPSVLGKQLSSVMPSLWICIGEVRDGNVSRTVYCVLLF